MSILNIQNILPSCVLPLGTMAMLAAETASATEPSQPDHTHRHAPLDGHDHAGFGGDLLTRDHLLGDPFGARSWLESQGFTIEATLLADFSKNLSGGVSHAGTQRYLFDLSATADLQKILGLDGATLFASLQTQHGQNGSTETGDLQAYSNIDADNYTSLYEIWYQQTLLDELLRIKVGKIDANVDFAFVENGGEFIHSSAGFSPTIVSFPTFPDPAFGTLAFIGEGGGPYAGVGVFDGALQEGIATGGRGPKSLFDDPADLFLVGEAGYAWGGGDAALPGRAAVGVWHHTGGFTTFAGGVESGTTGIYLLLDQQVLQTGDADDDPRGLYLFAQYGFADDDVSAVEHHAGLGVQWVGPIPGRADDVAGLMVSHAALSDQPGAGFTDSAETATEFFYKAQLTPWLSLKPDLQFITNPGGAGLDNAWVATVRIEIVF